ncbi:hypothetical protein AAW14_23055 [Streptomyces hygroscopicus]|uniref:hypothetical protein n=1 Tax=Streptomyces hygroscopicus TaxID=1912 RepID=UPI0022408B35|nr:hypothetical protein [Streptomyces hygroscopicus]MCW7944815.1 hypothetical protein [Streptomyces hygroscopicus]
MAGAAGTASRTSAMAEQRLDDEIEQITHALQEAGPTSGNRLEQAVGGRSGLIRQASDELPEALEAVAVIGVLTVTPRPASHN